MGQLINDIFVDAYLQCWVDAFTNPEMVRAWHGAHDWTVEHMNKVLYPLAKKLGYCKNKCNRCNVANDSDSTCKPNCPLYGTRLQQEYYKVDFSLYDFQDDDGWSLDYAIEHENAAFELKEDNTVKYSGWFNEFMKLLPLNCAEARVIIGYDEFLEKNGESEFEKKLKKCRSRLESDVVKKSLVDKPVLLIIFPYTNAMRKMVKDGEQSDSYLLQAVEFVCENGKWERHKISTEKYAKDIRKIYKKIIEHNKLS